MQQLIAYGAGRMRKNHIRIITGGKASLELSTYDLNKGYITFRHVENRSSASALQKAKVLSGVPCD